MSIDDDLRPPPEQDPPEAIIEKTGKWTYSVAIRHGIMICQKRTVLGHRRAERKARKTLRRYVASLNRPRWIIKS